MGRPLRVEPKPLELLILLVSQKGHLVSRREIVEKLWERDVFVDTDHSINTAIRKLRYLLRDDSETPKYIETVTGMGYRFVASVSLVAPASLDVPVSAAEPALPPGDTPAARPAAVSPPRRKALVWYMGVGACTVIALSSVVLYRWPHRRLEVRYTQLTDFTDSAVAPTLSPDGHMLAFIRGGNAFLTADQIYVKMLPDGEARRVTDDSRSKYGLAFSPDGSEIAYTVMDVPGPVFNTYEVSALGGEPQLLLKNAAGLVWLDSKRLLFSEIRSGVHLGVVTATVTRAGQHEIYFPAHERGMAHYSFPSPDRRWALVVEMNGNGDWDQCKLIDLDGQHQARSVGPIGACTSAGWSPNSEWMYFTAWVEGKNHIWRQRFSGGAPEQITFGATEEEGVAVEPGGRTLITSVGVQESAIWIHDGNGQRALSSEGEVVSRPVFSPDASVLYYLLRRGEGPGAELWRAMVDSGKSEAVFPGISMAAFDLSPDGKQVLYATAASDRQAPLWVAPVDRSSPATRVSIFDVQTPHFGDHGQILFQRTEGSRNYLERMNPDGSPRAKVFPYPIADFQNVSPGRHWAIVNVAGTPESGRTAIMAIPLNGGVPHRICASFCTPRWSPDGKFLFVPVEDPSRTDPGRSLAIPLGAGETLPILPEGGIAPSAKPDVVRGAKSVARGELTPGRDLEHYAWVNTTIHRNLYRISLP
ncbi:MAG TPA: winged helix-turn-helix domain-containing protein [Terracidiphilus sp.]|jgi:Tol biopolymer transport system component/DNA-binding winged helix-turn-helix (wHTH) protein|nr:winged helix-turn-helix domain-containing protein [Terracidiphilus sp.]